MKVLDRDSHSNCWVNLKIMGQPCEFQVNSRAPDPIKYAKYQTAMGTAAVGWRLDPAGSPNSTYWNIPGNLHSIGSHQCRRVARHNRRQSHKWLQWGVLLIIYSTPSTRRLASGCSVLQHFTCVVHNPKHSGRPCQNADVLDQSAVCTRPQKQGGSHAPRDEFAWFLPHTPSVAWPGRIATCAVSSRWR